MKIYVACLASYNQGILHGSWIEPTSDIEELSAEVAKVIESSPTEGAEEHAIHDYDGFPDLGEYPSLKSICDFVEMVEDSDFDADIVSAVVDEFSSDISTAQWVLNNSHGIYDRFQDYADELADDTIFCCNNAQVEWMSNYFDYNKHAEALSYDYIRIGVRGGVLIAPNR